jgi:hypothetical protein
MEVDMIDTSNRAPQACGSCRRQKRKCDKALPACSLCLRMSRSCDYLETTPNPTPEDFATMRQKIADLEERLQTRKPESWHGSLRSVSGSPNACNDPALTADGGGGGFPAAFFLDAEVFQEAKMSVPKPVIPVPAEVAATVGVSILDIQDVVDRYFTNIHTWLPYISKKRMEITLCNPSMELNAELALVLLSMKLIAQFPQNGPQSVKSPLYHLTKGYCSMLESQGVVSLQLLQANILIAAYEIGHAIYPAAYLTTGHCARLGHMLGLNDRQHAPQILKRKPGAWAELEEMKRTWWAVMLLDRCLSINFR